jgi:HAMP domain-containing protein
MIGRLRPGVSIGAIEARMQAAYALISPGLPAREAAFRPFGVAGLSPLNRQQRDAVRLFRLLMTAVGCLLVLACANAANLLVARASDRERDTAVRLALGSSRARVARQLLLESMALAGLGAAGGLVVAARRPGTSFGTFSEPSRSRPRSASASV